MRATLRATATKKQGGGAELRRSPLVGEGEVRLAKQRQGKKNGEDDGLSRAVSPKLLIFFALGTTLGAGIYVVIGEIIGAAGYWTPIAFLAASLVAAFTGASFAELTGRCPSSGGPAAWAFKAFGVRWLAIAVGWGIIATGIVSGATIATGFVAYAGVFVDWSKWWVLPILVGLPTAVAIVGVKQSAWFMGLTTAAGIVGLLDAVDERTALQSDAAHIHDDTGICVEPLGRHR